MTYGEAKTLVLNFLKGDNSNAEISNLIITQSLYEVATHCEPHTLIREYKCKDDPSINSDFFRVITPYEDDNGVKHCRYLRKPTYTNDDDEVDLPIDLHTALVFFCCAYLSFKNKDYYEQKAVNIISLYKSNNQIPL